MAAGSRSFLRVDVSWGTSFARKARGGGVPAGGRRVRPSPPPSRRSSARIIQKRPTLRPPCELTQTDRFRRGRRYQNAYSPVSAAVFQSAAPGERIVGPDCWLETKTAQAIVTKRVTSLFPEKSVRFEYTDRTGAITPTPPMGGTGGAANMVLAVRGGKLSCSGDLKVVHPHN